MNRNSYEEVLSDLEMDNAHTQAKCNELKAEYEIYLQKKSKLKMQFWLLKQNYLAWMPTMKFQK